MSKPKEKSDKIKEDLFAGAKQREENFSIQSLKSINSHLRESASLMDSYVNNFSLISTVIGQGAKSLEDIDGVYQGNQHSITKGKIFIKELDRRNKKNKLMVYGSFLFFISVVIFIFLRRLFFRDLYKCQWFSFSLFPSSSEPTFSTLTQNSDIFTQDSAQQEFYQFKDHSL